MVEEQKDYSQMTKEEIDELKYQQEQEKAVTLNKVIRGVNDVFKKDYDFKELGLSFHVEIKVPNALEQGEIYAKRARFLGGTDAYQPQGVYNAYEMLATLDVVGKEVPKEFKNPEDVYNLYPLMEMFEDWSEFLSTFRY